MVSFAKKNSDHSNFLFYRRREEYVKEKISKCE